MRLERLSAAGALRIAVLFVAGSWAGAMGFFGIVAGIVLSASPSRHAGGTVNRMLLDVVDLWSYVAAALLLALVLVLDRLEPLTPLQKAVSIRLLALAAAAAFASHEVITPEMMSLRDRMPSLIDLTPASDPLRRAWGRLHAFSSGTLVVRLAAVAAVFFLLARRARREWALPATEQG